MDALFFGGPKPGPMAGPGNQGWAPERQVPEATEAATSLPSTRSSQGRKYFPQVKVTLTTQ